MCSPRSPLAGLARTVLTNGLRAAAALERGGWRFALARGGVTALEYALMASLVAVAIVGGVAGFSGSLGTLMSGSFSLIAASM
jgi:Flp pilus assembly pilin Flp